MIEMKLQQQDYYTTQTIVPSMLIVPDRFTIEDTNNNIS